MNIGKKITAIILLVFFAFSFFPVPGSSITNTVQPAKAATTSKKTKSKKTKSYKIRRISFYAKSCSVLHQRTKKIKVKLHFSKIKSKTGAKIYPKVSPREKAIIKSKIKWKSTNKSIATIDKNGIIKGKNRGKCVITATIKKKKASITVYVKHNPKLNAQDIPILTFHRIVSDKDKRTVFPKWKWSASVKDFEQQIKYIHNNGYRTISMDEFYNWYNGTITLPENSVLLTCDDGYYETYHLMYPIIKKYQMKITNFIVGSWTLDKTEPYTGSNNEYTIGTDVMKKTKKEYPDFDYQSHSYDLHYFIDEANVIKHAVNMKTREEIKQDIENSRHFGFKYYAHPFGAVNDIIIEELKNSYIKMAFGFRKQKYATRNDDLYEINRLRVTGQTTTKQFRKLLDRY